MRTMKLKMHFSCFIDAFEAPVSHLVHLCDGRNRTVMTWTEPKGAMSIQEPVRCKTCKETLLELV